ncbi:MAG: hypothetical protein K6F75_09435 [Butyrivibrio sp.]|nr:hypothetical protein [Butyrivibrio sp.]
MKDIIILIAFIPLFAFGYHIMSKLDFFIAENEAKKCGEIKLSEPSSVIISGEVPLMEIDRRIADFRQKHPDFEIVLRDCSRNE